MSAGQDWDNIPGFDPNKEEYVPLDLDEWLARHASRRRARSWVARPLGSL